MAPVQAHSVVQQYVTLHLKIKNESADEINEDDNDASPEPYFVQFQSSLIDAIGNLHAEQTKTAIDREPPPGIPAYIALAVFRS